MESAHAAELALKLKEVEEKSKRREVRMAAEAADRAVALVRSEVEAARAEEVHAWEREAARLGLQAADAQRKAQEAERELTVQVVKIVND